MARPGPGRISAQQTRVFAPRMADQGMADPAVSEAWRHAGFFFADFIQKKQKKKKKKRSQLPKYTVRIVVQNDGHYSEFVPQLSVVI